MFGDSLRRVDISMNQREVKIKECSRRKINRSPRRFDADFVNKPVVLALYWGKVPI